MEPASVLPYKEGSLFGDHHDTYPFISPAKFDLSAKSVFITGASKGIGQAAAVAFAAAGCRNIALGARSSLAATEAAVREAFAARNPDSSGADLNLIGLTVDVTNDMSVASAAAAVSAAFGGTLDVLYANAGYLETFQPLAGSDPVDWWRTYQVNVHGVQLTLRYFLPLLLASADAGRFPLAVLSSSLAAAMALPGSSAYGTSKLAIARLAEFVHAEYSSRGLVAVAVHPGLLSTDLARGMPEAMHNILIDTPELAAHTVAWLVSEKREWLSGRWISFGWDMQELEKNKDDIVKKDLLKFRLAF